MYHPRVFKKNVHQSQPEKKSQIEETKEIQIPETTLYEEPLTHYKKPNKKRVVVFGFTPSNTENVIKRIREVCTISNIDYGRNWISVICTSGTDDLLKLNTTTINDEIIGVYKDTCTVTNDTDIYVRKEGVFKKILVYLFGDE